MGQDSTNQQSSELELLQCRLSELEEENRSLRRAIDRPDLEPGESQPHEPPSAESMEPVAVTIDRPAVIRFDAQGVIRECDEAATELFGYDSQEVVGQPISVLIPEDNRDEHQQRIRQIGDQSNSYREPSTLVGKNGCQLNVVLTVQRIEQNSSDRPEYQWIAIPRTRRTNGEASDRIAQHRLEMLLRSLDEVVWFSDEKGELRYIGNAVESVFERSPDEFLENAHLWKEIVDPLDRLIAERSAKALEQTGEADVEYRIRRPSGESVWVHDRKRVVTDDYGQRIGKCGIVSDITKRKMVEESERWSARCLETIHDLESKFIADAPPQLIFDELLASLLDLSESEYGFVGETRNRSDGTPYLKTHAITNIGWDQETRDFFEKNAPEGLEFDNLNSLFGHVIKTEQTVISNNPSDDSRSAGTPDGHPELRCFLGVPLMIRGELVGMAGIANRTNGYGYDLVERLKPILSVCASLVLAYRTERQRKDAETQLRETESQLAHVNRIATMGEMVAGIAHEVNQPLAAISNFSAACVRTIREQDNPDLETISGLAERIGEQALRCGDIIRRLRSFVQKSPVDHKRVDLNEIVRESVALVDASGRFNSIAITCHTTQQEIPVWCCRVQIQQIIVNLLQNACESTLESQVPSPKVRIYFQESSDTATVVVEDNGAGIAPSNLPRLFDPFFTTRPKGLGIGLAISRSIADNHEGRLWAESSVQKGARFFLQLPLEKNT